MFNVIASVTWGKDDSGGGADQRRRERRVAEKVEVGGGLLELGKDLASCTSVDAVSQVCSKEHQRDISLG